MHSCLPLHPPSSTPISSVCLNCLFLLARLNFCYTLMFSQLVHVRNCPYNLTEDTRFIFILIHLSLYPSSNIFRRILVHMNMQHFCDVPRSVTSTDFTLHRRTLSVAGLARIFSSISGILGWRWGCRGNTVTQLSQLLS